MAKRRRRHRKNKRKNNRRNNDSLATLASQVARMQQRGIVTKIRRLKTTIPLASTKAQLKFEIKARRAVAKHLRKAKKGIRRSLENAYRQLRYA